MAVVSPDCLQSQTRQVFLSTIDPWKVFLVKMKEIAHATDSAEQLDDARALASRIYPAIRTEQPLYLLRDGDTGAHIQLRPMKNSASRDHILAFLGRSVSEH